MGNTPKPKRTRTPAARTQPKAAATRGSDRLKYLLMGAGAIVLVALIAYISSDVSGNPQTIPDPPAGVETFAIPEIVHTDLAVDYDTDPPVGGPHSDTPIECRVYDTPIPNENAIHALEHGAVWITYQPGLDDQAVSALAGQASRSREVIISPYPGLDSPIVLSAWGVQLRVDSADDERIDTFTRAYLNQVAPENAAGC